MMATKGELTTGTLIRYLQAFSPTTKVVLGQKGTSDVGRDCWANTYYPPENPMALEVVIDHGKHWCERDPIPKGETMPQTVEQCQKIMARDAELVLEMKAETERLNKELKKLWRMTARGAGGGRLDEHSRGYDKAMLRIRIAIADVIKPPKG
jgi:hypothetical protein